MISGVNSSHYSYAPLFRSGGSDSSACSCGQSGCDCAATSGFQATSGNRPADSVRNGKDKTNDQDEINNQVAQATSANAKNSLTEAELTMVRELKLRDQKVRQHEMAHLVASGGLAQGGPHYTYQRGPDGQNYAVGGHVNLDISPGRTPEETLRKAQIISAAATAPADPSGQDRSIAARASQMAMKARMELAQQQQAMERNGQSQSDDDSPASRLTRRFFSAVTPQPEPSFQLAA
ncbi:MAG: hypothetical protein H6974_10520 [Gammaproteobacteria bacterium]|nr:hypothetical protein [Gammaproteobacteria bacterium]